MTQLNYRTATIDDLDTLSSIEQRCFPPLEAASAASFQERLDRFPEGTLVGYLGDDVIGFINGSLIPTPTIEDAYYHSMACFDHQNPYLAVYGLNTLEPYRGNGYAGALIKAYINLGKQLHCQAIVLTCKEKLIHYYESFGFINKGLSASTHGGVLWYDMYLPLTVI